MAEQGSETVDLLAALQRSIDAAKAERKPNPRDDYTHTLALEDQARAEERRAE